MRKLAIAALAATALTTSAFANKFDGPYIGAGIGIGIGDADLQVVTATPGSGGDSDLATLGVVGGIHGGWDKVFQNKWLLGLFVFGDLSSMDGKFTDRTEGEDTVTVKVDMDWSIGAGVRGGVVLGDCLIYLHAGWIGSEWEIKTPSKKDDDFLNAFRLGVGFETMLNEHIALGGEYAYSWYEDHKLKAPSGSTVKIDPNASVFRLKLSWRFKGIS